MSDEPGEVKFSFGPFDVEDLKIATFLLPLESYNCISGKLGSNLILVSESLSAPPESSSSTVQPPIVQYHHQDLQNQILIRFLDNSYLPSTINIK